MSVEIFKISGQTRRFTLCEKPSLVLGTDISSFHWTKLGIPRPGELCHLEISYRASSVFTVNITVDRLSSMESGPQSRIFDHGTGDRGSTSACRYPWFSFIHGSRLRLLTSTWIFTRYHPSVFRQFNLSTTINGISSLKWVILLRFASLSGLLKFQSRLHVPFNALCNSSDALHNLAERCWDKARSETKTKMGIRRGD